ncbi:hypothetical protein MCOR27_005831 [Pyricularia oryzae]|uniref:F-box domain-containing protein n=1 Tax=Pyricularia grisea TaxID=148305 RepID=A0ABQ8N3S2_PYRGI|nr:hypothetical protein MCOR01_008413 [Pyricularia oryzae]KAI6290230.1 hypothetical protein MCOR33_011418 [Pyricularia grisea]KAI6254303.1 hypothetical protein MCOR19_009177 [Pyricularia oryzae]KAI6277937.1 hypothetical protein MCOR27_005831 [Pyricularia oryzae]KAI6306101.1 hypothetical protein MCOR29_010247 [Pyricularia oryzae]
MILEPETQRLGLTTLPPEILHNVLCFVRPRDLARVSRTNKHLNNFVQNNGPLCREIYLRLLDDPSESAASADLDWQHELQDFVRLTRVCDKAWREKASELSFVHDVVVRVLKRSSCTDRTSVKRTRNAVTFSPSRNTALLAQIFADESTRREFLCQSFIWQRARGKGKYFDRPPKPEHQMSAKLHCLYGVPQLDTAMIGKGSAEVTPTDQTYEDAEQHGIFAYALAKVYDLRDFHPHATWGPFLADDSGRVDWERLEAIMIVIKHGISRMGLEEEHLLFDICWNRPFDGAWKNSYVPMPFIRPAEDDLDKEDPFGVSGTYLRVICFLDYGDFFNFNFHNGVVEHTGELVTNDMPRPVVSVGEAARLMMMKIHVTKIEKLEGRDEDKGPDAVVVHFAGFTELLHGFGSQNLSSTIKGKVRFTPDGEVRWTTISVFAGQERWSSEGIQIGGPKSAKCIVGNWFDVNHDPTGPVGPSAFWKISDRDPEVNDDKFSTSDVLPWFSPSGNGPVPDGVEAEEIILDDHSISGSETDD